MTQTLDCYIAASGPDTTSVYERLFGLTGVSMSMAGTVVVYAPYIADDLREAIAFAALSQDSFDEDWDNPEDAIYNSV